MANRRQGMELVSMWLEPSEKKEIENILKKEVKEESEIAIIGDIICSANARGDFNKR